MVLQAICVYNNNKVKQINRMQTVLMISIKIQTQPQFKSQGVNSNCLKLSLKFLYRVEDPPCSIQSGIMLNSRCLLTIIIRLRMPVHWWWSTSQLQVKQGNCLFLVSSPGHKANGWQTLTMQWHRHEATDLDKPQLKKWA